MLGTYRREDVTILLKDITGLVEPMGTKEREARIQSGIHYSEMLPLEYEPSPAYLAAFWDALERYADITARAAASAAMSQPSATVQFRGAKSAACSFTSERGGRVRKPARCRISSISR